MIRPKFGYVRLSHFQHSPLTGAKLLYIDYLHQIGGKLFYGAGTYWYVYHKALVRASNVPEFINMDHQTARQLLFQSGALFIRWSSHPSNQVTPWWWMICDHYDFARLRSNMRNQIRRGYKECTVQRVSVQWLADSGYECYKNAFLRYRHTTPANEDDFKAYILGLAGCDTLFECWAVFAKDRLAGYAICTVEEQRGVSMTDIKYDPAFLKCYSSYAMIDTLLKHLDKARLLCVTERFDVREKAFGLVTLHRPSNVDDRDTMEGIFDALSSISEKNDLILPLHPRTAVSLDRFDMRDRVDRIGRLLVVEPLGYLEFLNLMDNARFVLTDSGGIQEETTILGVPCLTLRENTERPVTITHGTNTLTGSNPENILKAFSQLNSQSASDSRPPLWDGKAANRIVNTLVERLQ